MTTGTPVQRNGLSASARRPTWLLALLSVAVSASAFYGSTGFGRFWPAAWIAPIPVLVVAPRISKWTAGLAAFAAYFLGSLNLFTYLTEVVPAALVAVLLVVPAVAFAVAVLISSVAVRRLAPWSAPFAFPAAWVSYEFLVSMISPHGTVMSLAYSQADFLPLIQIASLSGIWGITFLLTLIPSAVAVAWRRRSYRALTPAALISLMVFVFGFLRIQEQPREPGVRVGLAVTDSGIHTAFNTEDEGRACAVVSAYADRIARLARKGAQVVILPEKLVGVTPADSERVLALFSAAAKAGGVTLIAGLNLIAISPPRNVAVVFTPDGKVLTKYEKRYLLPGPETGYEAGTTPWLSLRQAGLGESRYAKICFSQAGLAGTAATW